MNFLGKNRKHKFLFPLCTSFTILYCHSTPVHADDLVINDDYPLNNTNIFIEGNEMIGLGPSAYGSVSQSAGTTSTVTGDLLIGANNGTGLYTLNGGTVTVGTGEYIGSSSGLGTFVQNGGSNTAENLDIGTDQNSQGSYELSSGTLNVATSENIGQWGGEGEFDQSGGEHTVSDILSVGGYGTGIYNLSGGTLNVTDNNHNNNGDFEWIGVSGIGIFNHTGGTNNALNIGLGSPGNETDNGGNGTYNLSGDNSQVNVDNFEFIGFNGKGIFNHDGGFNNTRILIVGSHDNVINEGIGEYNLYSGLLTISESEMIGFNAWCTGTFNQSGGSHTIGSDTIDSYLSIGDGGNGTYNLSNNDSQLIVNGNESIGQNSGIGNFTQEGGLHSTTSLNIGSYQNSHGSYGLSGGTLNVATSENIGQLGGEGVFNGCIRCLCAYNA